MATVDIPENGYRKDGDGTLLGLIDRYLRALIGSSEYRQVRQTFVPLRLVNGSGGDVVADLSEALKSSRRAVVLGDVGAGKTSLFLSTAYDYAAHWSHLGDPTVSTGTLCDERRVPIYVRLKPSSVASIEQQICTALSLIAGIELGMAEIQELLQNESLLIMFDEFSRIGPQHQLETLRALVRFITADFPDQSYAIALRSEDFPMLEAWFKDLPKLRILPLDDREIALVVSLLLEDRERSALLQRLSSDSDWWEIGRSPLVLNAACTLARRMASAKELQDVAFTGQLARELIARAGNADPVQIERCSSILAAFALRMMREGTGALDCGEDMQRLLIDSGLLVPDAEAGRVAFRDPLFKQFYGAMAMQTERARGLTLRDLATGPSYDGDRAKSVIMCILQSSDKRRLIAELVGDGRSGENVLLAARCLAQAGENAYRELVGIVPTNVELHQQYGRAFLKLKRYRQARQAFEDAMKLDPSRAGAHQELADVMVEQGDLDGAAREYEAALRFSGDEVDFRLGMANICARRGNLAEAAAHANVAAQALMRTQAELHHRQGHIREAEGNFDAALREYQAAIDLVESSHYWFHLGALHRRTGRLAEAEAALHRAISSRFDDVDAHREMGALLEERDQTAEALEEYRAAARLQRSAEICAALGRAYRKLGRLAQAEAELQQAIGLDPSAADAVAELGLVYERRGEHDKALECYRKALRMSPDVPEYYQRTGWLLRTLGKTVEAETELAIAVKLSPARPEYREQLGSVLADAGRHGEALKQYEAAASLRPGDPTYRHHIGVMHGRLGNYDAAIKALTEAIDLCSAKATGGEDLPLSTAVIAAEAYSALGLFYEQMENWPEAQRHHRAASDLMPFAKIYWLRQGLLHRRLGQAEKAVKALRRAVSLDPEDAEIRAELGATREAEGDIGGALEEYKKAFESDPDQARYAVSAAKAHRRLSQHALAKAVLTAALERGLESAELRRELAAACIATGDAAAALEQSRRANAIEPDSAESHIMLARSLLALERADEALHELDTAIALDPNAAEAYYQLARTYLQNGENVKADACALQATTLAPREVEYAYLAGHLCGALGRAGEAAEHLKRATGGSEVSPLWRAELGEVLESLGRLEEALAEYMQAAQNDAAPARHLFRAGRTLLALRRSSEAAEVLLRAISLDPSLAGAYAALGEVLLRTRQPKAAADRFRKACELNPKEFSYWDGLASASLAQDKLADAASELERALALSPDNASLNHRLGKVLTRLGKWDIALENLEKAVAYAPLAADYIGDLAIAQSRMGRHDLACAGLRQALSLEDRPQWHAELGDILAIVGDQEAALAEYHVAASQDPSDWRYRRKLGLLYLQLEQPEEALRTLEAACDLSFANGVDLATHHWLGLAYACVGRLAEALSQQVMAARRAPRSAAIHTAIGAVHRLSLAEDAKVAPTDEAKHQKARLALDSLTHALAQDPEFAEAYAELGALDELAGDLTGALDKHMKAVALSPTLPSYRCGAAAVYLKMGKFEEAQAVVFDGMKLSGESAVLVNQLGLIDEATGALPEALANFERAAALAPSKAIFRYDASRIHLQLGDPRKARRELAEAIRLSPREPRWRQQLAALYEQSEDWARAADELRSALELQPEDGDALLALGRVLWRTGRSDDAIESLQRAAAVKPTAAVFDQLAVVRRQQGQLREALRHSQQALRREGGNHGYQLNLALNWKALGEAQKANDEIQRIAREAPSLAPARYHLGAYFEERGDLSKALPEYLSAFELAPKEVAYAKAAGRVHRLLGQFGEAFALLNGAVKLAAGDPEILAELGRVEQGRRNHDRAMRYYRRAVALQDRPEFHSDLAKLFGEMGRWSDANTEIRVAVSAEPRNPRWQSDLGRLLEDQGKLDEAIKLYRQVLQADSQSAEFHRNLGVVLKKQGKFEEAIQELQRALDLKPDYADAYRHLTAASASELLRKTMRKGS